MAPVSDEPAPPAGVSVSVLLDGIIKALGPEKGQAFIQWFTTDEHNWSTEAHDRLKSVHDQCTKK